MPWRAQAQDGRRRAGLLALALLVALTTAPCPAAANALSGDAAAYPDWQVALVAHRGLSAGRPENTLAAYRQAIALGVDAIELDLRGTADGEVVVLHDATVDRTTNGTGNVSTLTLAQVRQLDAGGTFSPRFAGERIPTYGEVLKLVAGTGVKLLLDIKRGDTLDKARIVRLTEAHGAELDVIAGVRSLDDLRELRRLNPNIRTLAFVSSPAEIEAFAAAGADIIRLWSTTATVVPAPGSGATAAAPETMAPSAWIYDELQTPACQDNLAQRRRAVLAGLRRDAGSRSCLVQRVHDLGLPVWVSAIADPYEDLDQLVQLGVNGVLTDHPEVMARLRHDINALKGTHPVKAGRPGKPAARGR